MKHNTCPSCGYVANITKCPTCGRDMCSFCSSVDRSECFRCGIVRMIGIKNDTLEIHLKFTEEEKREIRNRFLMYLQENGSLPDLDPALIENMNKILDGQRIS